MGFCAFLQGARGKNWQAFCTSCHKDLLGFLKVCKRKGPQGLTITSFLGFRARAKNQVLGLEM